jgi:hypothetical protein
MATTGIARTNIAQNRGIKSMIFCAEVKFARAVEVDCVRVATVGDRASPIIQTTKAPIRTVEETLRPMFAHSHISRKTNINLIKDHPRG